MKGNPWRVSRPSSSVLGLLNVDPVPPPPGRVPGDSEVSRRVKASQLTVLAVILDQGTITSTSTSCSQIRYNQPQVNIFIALDSRRR